MKRVLIGIGTAVTAVLLGLVFLPGASLGAQERFPEWRGSGGWGAGLPYNRLYDSGKLQTLEGEVIRFDRLMPEGGMADGMSLSLRTSEGVVPVHLGPIWFLERQDLALVPGMRIQVTGSRIEDQGRPMLAAEVRRPDKVLLLRGEDGFPLWTAWRRR